MPWYKQTTLSATYEDKYKKQSGSEVFEHKIWFQNKDNRDNGETNGLEIISSRIPALPPS